MASELKAIARVVPEMEQLYWRRLKILRAILRHQPIGRKMLLDKVSMTERPLRTELERLKELHLTESTTKGMYVTELGEDVIRDALSYTNNDDPSRIRGEHLCNLLKIQGVRIIEGDLDQSPELIADIAINLAQYLEAHLPEGHITIAVTGGTTMMHAIRSLHEDVVGAKRTFTIVSARGGMGESIEIQSNSISARLAKQLKGQSIALYTPDNVSEQTYEILLKEPSIQDSLTELSKTDVVLFSVGDAIRMALRRGLSQDIIQYLKKREAVGEAFGCFFDGSGEIVYRMPRIGLQLEQLSSVSLPILIAGGHTKAKAIQAFAKLAPHQLILITDTGASDMVLNEETH